MRKILNKREFLICSQEKTHQFYFGLNYERKYFLSRFLKWTLNLGVCVNTHIEAEEWKQFNSVGLFFDFQIMNIRLGIYLHPIFYNVKK